MTTTQTIDLSKFYAHMRPIIEQSLKVGYETTYEIWGQFPNTQLVWNFRNDEFETPERHDGSDHTEYDKKAAIETLDRISAEQFPYCSNVWICERKSEASIDDDNDYVIGDDISNEIIETRELKSK